MDLLERALFSRNICSLDLCESGLSHQVIGSKVKIHREIVVLKPIRKFLISCQAKNEILIPKIHNCLAELTISGQFLIGSQLYSKKDLENSTLVNSQLHPLPEPEKLLQIFHHFSNYSSFFIQCLEPVSFSLNSKLVHCEKLEYFSLPENFEINYDGKTLKSQKLVQESHKNKVSWLHDFTFSNIDQQPIFNNPPLTMLHPKLEKFLFDEAGELRIDHVSYTGSAITIFILIVCGCCCWKVACFRLFFFSKGNMVVKQLYTFCTTEKFRLKKEKKGLDKDIDKSWAELKRMEEVIARKSELKRKLPPTSKDKVPSVPSGTEKRPSAPPLDQVVACEVHHEPQTARYSKRSSKSPAASSLDKN